MVAKSVFLQNLKNQRHVYVAEKYENLQIKTLGFVCRVVSSEISGGIFPKISGKITVLFLNNSAEKRTCQTPSYFRTMSTF